jgi:NitT/TauT family transport system permease protein
VTQTVAVEAPGGQAARDLPAPRDTKPRSTRLRLISVAAVVLGIAGWAAYAAIAQSDLLPGPAAVVDRAGELASSGELWANERVSLVRVLTGFSLGIAIAIPVGFVMGWYAIGKAVIDPYVQFFRTLPPLALIPLVVLTLGIGEWAKIFLITLAVFLTSVVATYQGVVNVDRTFINAARVLGANDLTVFARVVVPASLPYILTGMRIGLGAAWAVLVAAELIAAQSGLGRMMQQAQLYLDVPTIMVGLFAIGINGFVMDRLLQLADRRMAGWQERR